METPIFPESVSTNRIAIPISNSSVGSEANNLSCEQILQYQNQLSDVQFDEFLRGLENRPFSGWKAEVDEVKEVGFFTTSYTVNLRILDDCYLSWTMKDKAEALRYNKGHALIVSGEIHSVTKGLFGARDH